MTTPVITTLAPTSSATDEMSSGECDGANSLRADALHLLVGISVAFLRSVRTTTASAFFACGPVNGSTAISGLSPPAIATGARSHRQGRCQRRGARRRRGDFSPPARPTDPSGLRVGPSRGPRAGAG